MCGLVAAAAGLSLTACDGIHRRAKWRLGLSSPHETEILNEFDGDMRRAMQSMSGSELSIVDAADYVVKQLTDIEAFKGGEGDVLGVILAVVLLGVMNSGLVSLGIDPHYTQIVKGGAF